MFQKISQLTFCFDKVKKNDIAAYLFARSAGAAQRATFLV